MVSFSFQPGTNKLSFAHQLVDEACSALRIAQDSKPPELEAVNREIVTLEIERESLKNETDTFSTERKEAVERTLIEKKEEAKQMESVWESARNRLKEIKELKEVSKASLSLFPRTMMG